MEPTEIVIAYEDRLRLSELAGQLANLNFSHDHMILPAILIGLIFGLLVGFFVIVVYALLFESESRGAFVAIMIGSIIICIILTYAFMDYDISKDISDVQAQMDTIYELYNMKGV